MVNYSSPEVVLINPFLSREEEYGFKIEGIGNQATPPLGLAYLSAYLLKNSINVAVIDANAEELTVNEIKNKIRILSPKIVGITATTLAVVNAVKIIKKIKEAFPEIIAVMGGAHISALPKQTFSECSELDYGVIGEGEETFLGLVESITGKKNIPIESIKGLVCRSGKDGIRLTEPRPFIQDINKLPHPAYDLLPMDRYLPALVNYRKLPQTSVICSRGCPYQCIFCTKHIFGNKARFIDPEKIYQALYLLKERYGIKEINFYDDTFNLFPAWVSRVCDLIKDLNLIWQCNGKPDLISPELLKKMKKAGCYRINYGVESISKKSLKLLRKQTTPDAIRRAFRQTRNCGIETLAFMMFGIPGETWKNMMQSIEFVIELKADNAVFTVLTPYPGTVLYNNIEEYGTLNVTNWNKFICISQEPVFTPFSTTQAELKLALEKAYKKFVFRPRYILNRMEDMLRCPDKIIPYGRAFFSLLH